MHSRRVILAAGGAALLGASPVRSSRDFVRALAAIEAGAGGRLGVCVLEQSGRRTGRRMDERFPMCSTFKASAAAAVLHRVDQGRERLDRFVRYGEADLPPNAPRTRANLSKGGMTMEALCAAAVEESDNGAANLMLASLGGPAGVTAFLRGLGDRVTRLDRTEPSLNSAIPGDPRDTTSPAAMAASLRRMVLGDALSAASRARLGGWMIDCKTGSKRLRAGLPAGWRVGDKTGSGDNGSSNDIAVVWPPSGPALVVAVYFTGSSVAAEARDAAIAEVGRAVATAFG